MSGLQLPPTSNFRRPRADHRPGVDDFIEPLLVGERGLLQGQPFVIRLVRDGGSLVIADHRAERGHSTS
jgi:hypothetical protein